MIQRLEMSLMLMALCVLGLGCSKSADDKQTGKVSATANADHDHSHHEGAHHHYGAGPHGGSVLELGGDDYHAELVLDHDADVVKVFLLKADAKSPLLSQASEVTLVLDQGKSLSLKAQPLEGEKDGNCSRYELVDEDFIHRLLEKGYLHGDLNVKVGAKIYRTHLDLHFDNTVHEHKDTAGQK